MMRMGRGGDFAKQYRCPRRREVYPTLNFGPGASRSRTFSSPRAWPAPPAASPSTAPQPNSHHAGPLIFCARHGITHAGAKFRRAALKRAAAQHAKRRSWNSNFHSSSPALRRATKRHLDARRQRAPDRPPRRGGPAARGAERAPFREPPLRRTGLQQRGRRLGGSLRS